MIQRPVAVGLMLCEKIIVEEGTRNVTLVSCFSRLRVHQFPSAPHRMAVYVVLTDGQGEGVIDLILNRLDESEELFQQRQPIKFTGPLQEIGMLFRLNQCSFPAPGRYQILLLADGEMVAQKAFTVLPAEEQP
jgi:hypothetical protein